MGASFLAYKGAPAGPLVFQDNFNHGAGVNDALGANWDSNGLFVYNNVAHGVTGALNYAYVSSSVGTFGANQYVQFQPNNYLQSGSTSGNFAVFLRGGLCHMVWPVLASSYLSMRVYNANVFDTTIVPSIFDVVRFEAFGTALRIKLNGSLVWSGTSTNTDGTTVGQPGFGMTINLDGDNFECGELLA